MMEQIEEKIKRENMNNIRFKRIPSRGKRIVPIFRICSRCKKKKVSNHHFLCDKCWGEKSKENGKFI